MLVEIEVRTVEGVASRVEIDIPEDDPKVAAALAVNSAGQAVAEDLEIDEKVWIGAMLRDVGRRFNNAVQAADDDTASQ